MNSTKYWLSLNSVQGVGTATLKEIYDTLSAAGLSVSDIFGLTPSEIKNEFHFSEKIISAFHDANTNLDSCEREYLDLIDRNISVLFFFSPAYPVRLYERLGNSAPPVIYGAGNTSILNMQGAAILGDRNISSRGEFIAYMAARDLVNHDIAVISGLARGADLAAHRSALESGGYTAAWLPYGIEKLVIPEQLRTVFDPERFIAVSHLKPAEQANKFNAFTRNRLVCAASAAVFIVESPDEGGIFEAAKSAHKLNVPLYTAEYSEYPAGARGNMKMISDFEAKTIRGKKVDNLTVPNMDRFIADVKFRKE